MMTEVSFDNLGFVNVLFNDGRKLRKKYLNNTNKWHNNFESALYGFSQRILGIEIHYNALHSWYPIREILSDSDYHLATCLFHMDSSLECLVFALNSIGNVIDVQKFHDINNEIMLKKIGPINVIGDVNGNKRCMGYKEYFPRMSDDWTNSKTLIEAVMNYHDVSKHRRSLFGSGMSRNDPPKNFMNGINKRDQFLYIPPKDIILGPNPKSPIGQMNPDWEDYPYATLEGVMKEFKPFIEKTLQHIVVDMSMITA